MTNVRMLKTLVAVTFLFILLGQVVLAQATGTSGGAASVSSAYRFPYEETADPSTNLANFQKLKLESQNPQDFLYILNKFKDLSEIQNLVTGDSQFRKTANNMLFGEKDSANPLAQKLVAIVTKAEKVTIESGSQIQITDEGDVKNKDFILKIDATSAKLTALTSGDWRIEKDKQSITLKSPQTSAADATGITVSPFSLSETAEAKAQVEWKDNSFKVTTSGKTVEFPPSTLASASKTDVQVELPKDSKGAFKTTITQDGKTIEVLLNSGKIGQNQIYTHNYKTTDGTPAGLSIAGITVSDGKRSYFVAYPSDVEEVVGIKVQMNREKYDDSNFLGHLQKEKDSPTVVYPPSKKVVVDFTVPYGEKITAEGTKSGGFAFAARLDNEKTGDKNLFGKEILLYGMGKEGSSFEFYRSDTPYMTGLAKNLRTPGADGTSPIIHDVAVITNGEVVNLVPGTKKGESVESIVRSFPQKIGSLVPPSPTMMTIGNVWGSLSEFEKQVGGSNKAYPAFLESEGSLLAYLRTKGETPREIQKKALANNYFSGVIYGLTNAQQGLENSQKELAQTEAELRRATLNLEKEDVVAALEQKVEQKIQANANWENQYNTQNNALKSLIAKHGLEFVDTKENPNYVVYDQYSSGFSATSQSGRLQVDHPNGDYDGYLMSAAFIPNSEGKIRQILHATSGASEGDEPFMTTTRKYTLASGEELKYHLLSTVRDGISRTEINRNDQEKYLFNRQNGETFFMSAAIASDGKVSTQPYTPKNSLSQAEAEKYILSGVSGGANAAERKVSLDIQKENDNIRCSFSCRVGEAGIDVNAAARVIVAERQGSSGALGLTGLDEGSKIGSVQLGFLPKQDLIAGKETAIFVNPEQKSITIKNVFLGAGDGSSAYTVTLNQDGSMKILANERDTPPVSLATDVKEITYNSNTNEIQLHTFSGKELKLRSQQGAASPATLSNIERSITSADPTVDRFYNTVNHGTLGVDWQYRNSKAIVADIANGLSTQEFKVTGSLDGTRTVLTGPDGKELFSSDVSVARGVLRTLKAVNADEKRFSLDVQRVDATIATGGRVYSTGDLTAPLQIAFGVNRNDNQILLEKTTTGKIELLLPKQGTVNEWEKAAELSGSAGSGILEKFTGLTPGHYVINKVAVGLTESVPESGLVPANIENAPNQNVKTQRTLLAIEKIEATPEQKDFTNVLYLRETPKTLIAASFPGVTESTKDGVTRTEVSSGSKLFTGSPYSYNKLGLISGITGLAQMTGARFNEIEVQPSDDLAPGLVVEKSLSELVSAFSSQQDPSKALAAALGPSQEKPDVGTTGKVRIQVIKTIGGYFGSDNAEDARRLIEEKLRDEGATFEPIAELSTIYERSTGTGSGAPGDISSKGYVTFKGPKVDVSDATSFTDVLSRQILGILTDPVEIGKVVASIATGGAGFAITALTTDWPLMISSGLDFLTLDKAFKEQYEDPKVREQLITDAQRYVPQGWRQVVVAAGVEKLANNLNNLDKFTGAEKEIYTKIANGVQLTNNEYYSLLRPTMDELNERYRKNQLTSLGKETTQDLRALGRKTDSQQNTNPPPNSGSAGNSNNKNTPSQPSNDFRGRRN